MAESGKHLSPEEFLRTLGNFSSMLMALSGTREQFLSMPFPTAFDWSPTGLGAGESAKVTHNAILDSLELLEEAGGGLLDRWLQATRNTVQTENDAADLVAQTNRMAENIFLPGASAHPALGAPPPTDGNDRFPQGEPRTTPEAPVGAPQSGEGASSAPAVSGDSTPVDGVDQDQRPSPTDREGVR